MSTAHDRGLAISRVRVDTELGGFIVEATARGLRAVTPIASSEVASPGGIAPVPETDAAALVHARAAAEALRRYSTGECSRHEGPIDIAAPALHRAVWGRLRAIPFGATTTYGAIAAAVGMNDARAIGAVVGANPICVLIPCHRVVGADGSLRGFAWGLDLKRRLLAHEGKSALPLFADAGSA